MRKVYLFAHFFFGMIKVVVGQGPYPTYSTNHIVEQSPRLPLTMLSPGMLPTAAITKIDYFDGLGRPKQTILAAAQSNQQSDIVITNKTYDSFGRLSEEYLTFPSSEASSGAFASSLTGASFYGQTNVKLVNEYENNPLNRINKSTGPGDNWSANNKAITQNYTTASILRIEATPTSLVGNGLISTFKRTTTNEEGQRVIEYKDNLNRVLRKEVELSSNVFSVTAYVYDNMERLVAVIQPKFFELNAGNFALNENTEAFTEAVFAYKYDARGRLIQKHMPGFAGTGGGASTGWEEFVYDRNDRIVFTQNPRQSETNLWSFTLYDVFGRNIISGEWQLSGENRSSLQSKLDAHLGASFEQRNNIGPIFYSFTNSIPSTIGVIVSNEIQAAIYYDTYANIENGGSSFQSKVGFPTNYITDVRGLQIGTRTLNNETGNWIRQTQYYDNKLNIIFSRKLESNNTSFAALAVHDQWNSHSFSQQVLKTDNEYTWKANQTANLETTVTSEEFEYDNINRPLKYYFGVNAPAKLLTEYEYDQIGRLNKKKIYDGSGSNGSGQQNIIRQTAPSQTQQTDQAPEYVIYEAPTNGELVLSPQNSNSFILGQIGPAVGSGLIQTINYNYHIRGGIRQIQGELFALNLDYEINGGRYDGNITKQSWTINNLTRSYNYTYDLASRFLTATYSGGNTSISENFGINTPITYDKNGNIQTLQRSGVSSGTITSPASYGVIDNLTYTYTNNYSNKLLKVVDAVTGNMANRGDFFNFNGTNNDYTYYKDGSLKTDANKGITEIKYNQFNLVKQVIINGYSLDYTYDGLGQKIKKKTSFGQETIYAGSLILEKNTSTGNFEVYQIAHAEGRYTTTGLEFAYQDHLGNTRLMFQALNSTAVVTQINAYDPWGMELKGIGQEGSVYNRFKYNGKEEQPETAWIDYGARMYDAQLGRWHAVDPLAEKFADWNPYNYVFNNPLNSIDPTGMEGEDVVEKSYYTDGYGTWENLGQADGGWTVRTQATQEGGGGCGGPGQPPCPEKKRFGQDALEFIFWGNSTIGNAINNANGNVESTPLEDFYAGTFYLFNSAILIHGTYTILPRNGSSSRATPSRSIIQRSNAAKGGVGGTVDFVAGVQAKSFGKVVGEGTVHVRPTINAIENGSLLPRNATGYLNKELHPQLLGKPAGYWQEYHMLEFGSKSPLRILRGGQGEYFLSPDHYKSIIPLNH